MSLKLGTIPIAGLAPSTKYNAHDLFDFKWSDHIINDMNWLQSEGSWCDGTVYSNAYNHLVADISGITAETETIAEWTITFYRATDGHKIVLAGADALNVERIYRSTGIAWYYILDTTNTRFKLPRSEWGFVGARFDGTYVGDYVEAGLPNITGTIGANGNIYRTFTYPSDITGAFVGTTGSYAYASYQNSDFNGAGQIDLDASRSSSIYGNSDTVQSPATQMYLYFYVGEFSQTATEQTAGLNSQLFNGKADTDLANTTNKLSNSFISKLTPDYDNPIQIQITGINVPWTVPVAGVLNLQTVVAASNGVFALFINGVCVFSYNQINHVNRVGGAEFILDAGDEVSCNWSNLNEFMLEYFPLKGAN